MRVLIIPLLCLLLNCCGGPEEECRGPTGVSYTATPTLVISTCWGTAQELPPFQLSTSKEEEWQRCGTHQVLYYQESEGECTYTEEWFLTSSKEKYKGLISFRALCNTISCIAAWELLFKPTESPGI